MASMLVERTMYGGLRIFTFFQGHINNSIYFLSSLVKSKPRYEMVIIGDKLKMVIYSINGSNKVSLIQGDAEDVTRCKFKFITVSVTLTESDTKDPIILDMVPYYVNGNVINKYLVYKLVKDKTGVIYSGKYKLNIFDNDAKFRSFDECKQLVFSDSYWTVEDFAH